MPQAPENLGELVAATKARLRPRDVAEVFAQVEAHMRAEAEEIAVTRESVWPVVGYEEVANGAVDPAIIADIHRRGCVVVRRTFPRELAEQWDTELAEYLARNDFLADY